MEDRYLYKAKRKDNREWVQGALLDGENHCLIGQEIKFSPYTEHECKIVGYEVDKDTICQCTAMPDKNKKLVFEHDIVWDSDERAFYKIIWNQEDMCWNVEDADGCKCAFEVCYGDTIEVNGNIFDNPELLERKR